MAPKGGAQTQKKGWRRRVGPRRVGGPKFSRFFFRFPPPILLFLSLTVCLPVVFWWCLKRRGRQMCTFGVLGLLCEVPAAPKPPGFHTTQSPNVHIWGSRSSKTPPKFNEKTPRETEKERNGGGRGGKKSEMLGGPAEGGLAEGRVQRPVVWGRVVQGSEPTTTTTPQPQQHQHARSGVEVKPRMSVAQKGGEGAKGARRVGSRRVGPLGSGLSPGLRVWLWEGLGSRPECKSLGLGFGLFGFRKFDQNTKTQKLAKVGLAQIGQAHDWPKSVKKLAKVGMAKVGLAKVGLAKVGHDRARWLCDLLHFGSLAQFDVAVSLRPTVAAEATYDGKHVGRQTLPNTVRCGVTLDFFSGLRWWLGSCLGRPFPLFLFVHRVFGIPHCSQRGTITKSTPFVSDGLTLWQGAQLTLDTTLVFPLRRDGSSRPRAADHNGAALEEARRRKERTYPELSGDGGRARLEVLAAEVGGRWSIETANFLVSLAKAKALASPFVLQGGVRVHCFVARPPSSARSRDPFGARGGAWGQIFLRFLVEAFFLWTVLADWFCSRLSEKEHPDPVRSKRLWQGSHWWDERKETEWNRNHIRWRNLCHAEFREHVSRSDASVRNHLDSQGGIFAFRRTLSCKCLSTLIFELRCSILASWRRTSLSAVVCLNLLVVVVMKLVSLHILSRICFSRVALRTQNESQDLVAVFPQDTFPAFPQVHSVSFLTSSFARPQCCCWNFGPPASPYIWRQPTRQKGPTLAPELLTPNAAFQVTSPLTNSEILHLCPPPSVLQSSSIFNLIIEQFTFLHILSSHSGIPLINFCFRSFAFFRSGAVCALLEHTYLSQDFHNTRHIYCSLHVRL